MAKEEFETVNSASTVVLPCGTAQFVKWARQVYDRCQWCNQPLKDYHKRCGPSRDHLEATSKGGPNVVENIVLSCRACNELRGNKTPSTKRPFYGPRWKRSPVGFLTVDEKNPFKFPLKLKGQCTLWAKPEAKKWQIVFQGTYKKCHNYKLKLKKKRGDGKINYMVVPAGVMIDKKFREERLTEIIERRERVAVRAYFKWVHSGYQHGQDVKHWLEAEEEESDTA